MELYQQLEKEFGEWAGVKNVVVCSSGTAALHLALEALQLPQGSEVLVPDFTMIACPRAVAMASLVPVFIDCTDNLLMDTWLTTEGINEKTSAIMPVHIYGRQCLMEAIHKIAAKWNLKVVEDLAEAHGVRPHPESAAACWSFYKNKIIAGEEGGAVAFRDPEVAEIARSLRNLGFTDAHDFNHIPRGHNYRLANCLADRVLHSLEVGKGNLAKRRIIEQWYDTWCPLDWRMPKRDVPWVYDIRIGGMTEEKQGRLVRRLNQLGVEARHAFKSMSVQEEFADCRVEGNGNANRLSREVIYLPIQPEMTEGRTKEIMKVARVEYAFLDCRHEVTDVRRVY